MKKIFLISSVFILSLISCSSNAQNDGGDQKETKSVENAYLLLAPQEFKEKLNSSANAQLIDVRTASEFNSGSIENAHNFDIMNGSFQKQISSLDKSKPVFVFCAKGGRSNKASQLLKESGFSSVIDLKGGYDAWSQLNP